MTLSATVKVSVSGRQTGALDLSTQSADLPKVYSQVFSDGAGADQAQRIFADTRTLAASANEDLDLSGSLTDILGAAVVFTKVKAVIIKASASNSNNVNLTRPASNGVPLFLAAGDGIALAPGEVFVWLSGQAAGKTVTAGTGDLINLANSAAGSSVSYDIIVIGATS